jgi:Tfp pilus assembly protein PilV
MQRGIRTRKTAGFTIIEVAMAGAVLALSIASALVAMGRAFSPLDSARCISYASQIMQSEMEKMRLTTWGNGTAAGNGTTGITAYPTTPTAVTFSTSGFTSAADLGSRMTMTRTASDIHTGMIQITLTISWTTSDRRPMSRSYITYYGQNGLYDFIV